MAQDNLDARIDEMLRSQKKATADKQRKYDQSRIGRASADFKLFGRFWLGLTVTLVWLYRYTLCPVARAVWWCCRKLFRGYVRAWTWWAYRPDQYGTLQFHTMRSVGGVLATVVFLALFGTMLETVAATGAYFATVRHDEVVYLNKSQEILPGDSTHNIEGCLHHTCSPNDAIYFRVMWTPFDQLWYLVHGHGLFWPEYVAGGVPSDISRCTVTSYGLRLKTLLHYDVYPHMLWYQCNALVLDNQDKDLDKPITPR